MTGRDEIDWSAYLARFHAERPGITEDVLGRCLDDAETPYDWLRRGLAPDRSVADLACGSGPARPDGSHRWVGIDRSTDELARAVNAGRPEVVRGDATRLPLASGSVDAVTCSMALMLVDPLDDALAEIGRVLRPGGELRLLLPARTPITTGDRVLYLRLFGALRATTQFPPTPLRHHARSILAGHGLRVRHDESRRFALPLASEADAERFVDSWYLPSLPADRVASARRVARHLVGRSIGIPLRRVFAVAT